ncbi:HNH endonuclease [Sulfitobacter sp. JB4-11]|uniref:HNH endonuclease n=1 Tax=Sulfitobacter rhodophyticola TaxID=3238304 RepID=UPI003D816DD5
MYAVEQTVGDWIVYYRPGRQNAQVYFAVAKISHIEPNLQTPGNHLAVIAPHSFLEFDADVSRVRQDGTPWESALAGQDGRILKSGGRRTEAVRLLPDNEFAAIVNAGLPPDLEVAEASLYEAQPQLGALAEADAIFERPVIERLTRRPYRDIAFRRKVRNAYDNRCAMSGLGLRNGGGRPEVQAAHIRPVEENGNDTIRNGLALSATLHWMFDRGLVSVNPDLGDPFILISENKVPRDVVDRLIVPDRMLRLPKEKKHWPDPSYLRWHKENRFGQGSVDGLFPKR